MAGLFTTARDLGLAQMVESLRRLDIPSLGGIQCGPRSGARP
jgi:hypothetical protein